MIYEQQFLLALLFTVFIETAVLFIITRLVLKLSPKKIPSNLLLFTGLICSFATLPYVWFIFPMFFRQRIAYIIFAEAFAVLLESAIIYYLLKLSFKKSFAISLVCNATSFLLGLLLQ